MKRPAIITAAAVVPFSFLLSFFCDIRISTAAAALSFAAVFVMLFFIKKSCFPVLIITAAALLLASLSATARQGLALSADEKYKDGAVIEGTLLTEPEIRSGGGAVFEVAPADRPLSRVRVYADVSDVPASLTTGDRVSFTASGLARSLSSLRRSLAEGVECDVAAVTDVTVLSSGALPVTGFFNRLSASAFDVISSRVGERFGAVAAASVTGDGLYLADEEDVAALRSAGVAHYFCVSGFHLSVLTGVLMFFTVILGGKGVPTFAVTAAASLFAVFFAGFTPSVIRAALMCTLSAGAFAFGRKTSVKNALLLVAALFLAVDPFALFSPSFALSFAAVFGISLIIPLPGRIAYKLTRDDDKREMISTAISPFFVTVGASALTLPVSALFFGSGPVYAVLANIVCSPFAVLLFASAAFTLFPDPAVYNIAATLCRGAASIMTDLSKAVSSLPGADVSPSVALIVAAAVFAVFALLALGKRTPKKARVAAASLAILMLPVFVLSGRAPAESLFAARENGVLAAAASSGDESFLLVFQGDAEKADEMLAAAGLPAPVFSDGGTAPSIYGFDEVFTGLSVGNAAVRMRAEGAVVFEGSRKTVLFLKKGFSLKKLCEDGDFYDIIVCEGCPVAVGLLMTLRPETVISISADEGAADALAAAADSAGAVFYRVANGKRLALDID